MSHRQRSSQLLSLIWPALKFCINCRFWYQQSSLSVKRCHPQEIRCLIDVNFISKSLELRLDRVCAFSLFFIPPEYQLGWRPSPPAGKCREWLECCSRQCSKVRDSETIQSVMILPPDLRLLNAGFLSCLQPRDVASSAECPRQTNRCSHTIPTLLLWNKNWPFAVEP